MKITAVQIKNYRSINELRLTLPTFYSAVCGKNDSGKTNVLRALRATFQEEDPYPYSHDDSEISVKDDFPKWFSKDQKDDGTEVEVQFAVYRDNDEGLYRFLTDYLLLSEPPDPISVTLTTRYTLDVPDGAVSVQIGDITYERLKSEEVKKKLQSSRVVLFHNSTAPEHPYAVMRRSALLGDVSVDDREKLETAKQRFNAAVGRIAKRQQKDVSELLGRLKEKYTVGLSVPKFDPTYLPFGITLGEKGFDVPLENWGSGTQNRTMILMTLFKARRVSQAATSASKITPILVVEEPESFLHPSAQAEFGGILQELSEEFKVQVIVTTHSPYMLSQEEPSANLLLERSDKGQVRETRLVDTSGDRWMEPFGLALGIANEQFEPWREALFSTAECILMVEGETDKEYFQLMRDPAHADNELKYRGEIFCYGGKDTLKQKILLKFIKDRHKRCFITYDLDAEHEVTPSLNDVGFQKIKDYMAIGLDAAGKKAIEGLLPESVTRAVYSANPDLVQQGLHGTRDEQKSAKSRLKKLLLEEFKRVAVPGDEYYKGLYRIARAVDRALVAA